MATRATYKIDDTVFYCHWDGYPAGAASRFARMVEAMTCPNAPDDSFQAVQDRRGGQVFAFIRGNLDAEPAHLNRHEGHGDTEFRYDVQVHGDHALTVRVGSRALGTADRWTYGSPVPLAAFINQHGGQLGAPVVCLARLPGWGGRTATLATADSARRIAEREQAIATRFQEWNPNKASHEAKAEAWKDALASVADLEAARHTALSKSD